MSEMISVAEGFQYSVNIAYDLHADDKLKSYIPTQSALQLMEDILQSTLPTATDRSRVLIGAYGKGKSHIVLTILALLMKRDLDLFEKLLPAIQKRDKLNRLIQNYYASDNKLLPVIITGSNTSLTQAFLLALQQTLKENDLLNIMPDTNYKAAVSVIERWKNDFPDTYQQFKNKIADSISSFISRLEDYDIKAYEEFERIYPSLTAGSTFNPFVGFDVVQLYESVVQALKAHGYTGVYVIYDEFSKYLEAYANILNGSEVNEDFSLTFFKTLAQLNELDIRILRCYAGYMGDGGESVQDICENTGIDYTQVRFVKEKLSRYGLLQSRNEEINDKNMESMVKYMQDVERESHKSKPKDVKVPKLKKPFGTDSYSITMLGRRYLALMQL